MTRAHAVAGNHPIGRRPKTTVCCHPACEAEPWPDAPFALCQRHYVAVVRHWERIKNGPGEGLGLALLQSEHAIGDRRAAEHEAKSLVYFVTLRDLVKIGTTTDLRRRLSELHYDKLLRTIPGGMAVEHAWHERWAHLRHKGEWFRLTPELLAAIAEA